MRNIELTKRCGFTLVELVLVVMILAILAGFVVPMLGGLSQINTPTGSKSDRQIVTETTMLAIRDTFMSTETRSGVWADLGHVPNRLPRTIGQLFGATPPLAGTPPFDPATRIGWRGPYVQQPTGTYPDVTSGDWASRNFTANYGAPGDLALVDAWGNPIVLQIDFDGDDSVTAMEAQAARLVSAGANGRLDWALNETLTQADYLAALQSNLTDDVVVYLGISL